MLRRSRERIEIILACKLPSSVLHTFPLRLLCVFSQLVPRGFLLLRRDLFLDLGLLVELVEVVDDDWNGQRDAEHSTDSTGWKWKYLKSLDGVIFFNTE